MLVGAEGSNFECLCYTCLAYEISYLGVSTVIRELYEPSIFGFLLACWSVNGVEKAGS